MRFVSQVYAETIDCFLQVGLGKMVAVQPPRRLSSPGSTGRIETKRGAEWLRKMSLL